MTTARGDEEPDETGPFDIYETADGPRHVGNMVRRLILSKMHGSELTVPEMIDATGLTKSTISTHLAVLYKERLVAYREDPTDRRRKRYYLTARHVGTTRPCTDRLPFHADVGRLDEGGIGRLLLRALLAELACCGLDLRPVVRETGRRVGELAAAGRHVTDTESWARHAARFWSDAGLGTLELIETDPPLVRVRSCGLCFPGADRRMSLCAVTAGIIEGMASEMFRAAVEVEEVPQAGADEDDGCGCAFRLSRTQPANATATRDETAAALAPEGRKA